MTADELNARLAIFRKKVTKKNEKPTEQKKLAQNIRARFMMGTLPKLRPAEIGDYKEWLRGFIEAGGEPCVVDIPMRALADIFYVAMEDFRMERLCGANAIYIIVPKGINFLGGDLGHCTLYTIQENIFQAVGSFIPLFNDVYF